MQSNAIPARPSLRRRVLTAHRWLSLGAAGFWLLQAITGVLIVFHWEIADASLSTIHHPTNLHAIEQRVDVLVEPGGKIGAVWTTGGLSDRYEIDFEDKDGASHTVQIAGNGTIIETPPVSGATVMAFLVGFHHDLLGAWGSWIVSVSGILLCTNLILGLAVAWPKRGTWRLALKPATRGPAAARLYSWHRAVGLWAVVPALVIAATGTLMKFEDGLGAMVGETPVTLPANPVTAPPIGFATAATVALTAIPGSTLVQVAWPREGDATYRVRVRAPGEIRRAYGGSIVLVDANTGTIRAVHPIADAEPARAFMSALFPIHTGEAAGLIGRLLTLAIGLWLIVMIAAGGLLWLRRRRPKPKGQ